MFERLQYMGVMTDTMMTRPHGVVHLSRCQRKDVPFRGYNLIVYTVVRTRCMGAYGAHAAMQVSDPECHISTH